MGFMTCGILVSQAGTEPVSPALEDGFLTTGPPGKSLHVHCCDVLYFIIKEPASVSLIVCFLFN